MSTLTMQSDSPTTALLDDFDHRDEILIDQSDSPTTALLDDLDRQDEVRRNDPLPLHLPPLNSAPINDSTPYELASHSRVLARLLDLADAYSAAGSPRQATEMYFELVREHAETPQSRIAEQRLLDVARAYEQAGELRQARGIYEQLA